MGGRCQGPTREAFAEGSGPALDADSRLTRHDRPYKQSGADPGSHDTDSRRAMSRRPRASRVLVLKAAVRVSSHAHRSLAPRTKTRSSKAAWRLIASYRGISRNYLFVPDHTRLCTKDQKI